MTFALGMAQNCPERHGMSNTDVAYTLGVLAGALAHKKYLTREQVAKPDAPLQIERALKEYTRQEDPEYLADIVDALPMSAFGINVMLNDAGGAYWLGYYHARAAASAGKPFSPHRRGRTTPIGGDVARVIVLLPADVWEWCKDNGGGEMVRLLVEAEYARRTK